jgi:hypothetical protein
MMYNMMARSQSDRIDEARIGEIIAGQSDGDAFLCGLAGNCSISDALFEKVLALATHPAKLKGFCRAIQKFVERVSP